MLTPAVTVNIYELPETHVVVDSRMPLNSQRAKSAVSYSQDRLTDAIIPDVYCGSIWASHQCSLMCFSCHNGHYEALMVQFSGTRVMLLEKRSLLTLHKWLLSHLHNSHIFTLSQETRMGKLTVQYGANKYSSPAINTAFTKRIMLGALCQRAQPCSHFSDLSLWCYCSIATQCKVFLVFCPLPVFMSICAHTDTQLLPWLTLQRSSVLVYLYGYSVTEGERPWLHLQSHSHINLNLQHSTAKRFVLSVCLSVSLAFSLSLSLSDTHTNAKCCSQTNSTPW